MPYRDKERQKQYLRDHYRGNKDRYRESQARRRKQRRDFVDEYKLKKGCAKCGYDKCPDALEFHHKNPESKDSAIANMVIDRVGWGRLKAELEKCIVLCANCHRELHWESRGNGG